MEALQDYGIAVAALLLVIERLLDRLMKPKTSGSSSGWSRTDQKLSEDLRYLKMHSDRTQRVSCRIARHLGLEDD